MMAGVKACEHFCWPFRVNIALDIRPMDLKGLSLSSVPRAHFRDLSHDWEGRAESVHACEVVLRVRT